MRRPHILILGGTTEARQMAGALAARDTCDILLSLAGRTETPLAQPVPVRIGGFGGAEGLAAFIRQEVFHLVIDATHPFARRISANLARAVDSTETTAFALRRAEWSRTPEDRWVLVSDIDAAVMALGPDPRRVFLTIGRQEVHAAETAPWHYYLVRSVDPVDPPLGVPNLRTILDRGPFDLDQEMTLLKAEAIEVIVAKNSGGSAAYAKIAAARLLGIEVIMITRPPESALHTVETVEAALREIDHLLSPGIERGV